MTVAAGPNAGPGSANELVVMPSNLPDVRSTVVLNGAAHRLRPKLLTEAITLLSLAPLLLSTGPGSEILRPMVIPVLGGLLIADEIIDLFLPILFYRIRLARLHL